MLKVIRDGKVAVLYSPGYGAGWFTWNSHLPELLYHPVLVEFVEDGRRKEIDDDLMIFIFGEEKGSGIFTGGARQLEIEWLTEGTLFQVEEYDGSESLSIRDKEQWLVA